MLTLLGVGQGQNSSFDADYQAVLNRATTLGYTLPSASQRIKQNTLLLALKAGGVWTKLDILYIFANDGGSDFATLNWKSPLSNQATLINTPTFTNNQGFTGNGTSSFINTNFNPATQGVNYTRLDASRYYYQFGTATSITIDGIVTDSAYNKIRLLADTSSSINSTNASSVNSPWTVLQGFKSIHRLDANNIILINNITSISATQTVAASLISENQLILRRGAVSYSNNKVSAYAMGASLVSENTAFVNAFNTYITSL
jgi:hypothetical protein